MKSHRRVTLRDSAVVLGLIALAWLLRSQGAGGQLVGGEAEGTPASTVSLISELNQIAASPAFVELPAITNAAKGGALSSKSWDLRERLAAQGVCVRYKDGVFTHATRAALNGHVLPPNDQQLLAWLNYLEQLEQATKEVCKNYRSLGESPSRIDALRSELTVHGVSVEWNGDLYVIQSVRANPGTAADATGQQTNLTPINASTPSPER